MGTACGIGACAAASNPTSNATQRARGRTLIQLTHLSIGLFIGLINIDPKSFSQTAISIHPDGERERSEMARVFESSRTIELSSELLSI